jgi:hypothetical protein
MSIYSLKNIKSSIIYLGYELFKSFDDIGAKVGSELTITDGKESITVNIRYIGKGYISYFYYDYHIAGDENKWYPVFYNQRFVGVSWSKRAKIITKDTLNFEELEFIKSDLC